MEVRIEPVEWEMRYPARTEPIGRIRRRRDGFHAKLADEHLGVQPDGDTAAWIIWRRFCDQTASQHAEAAVTHGSRERHR